MTSFANSKTVALTNRLAQGGVAILMLSVFPVAALSFFFHAV